MTENTKILSATGSIIFPKLDTFVLRAKNPSIQSVENININKITEIRDSSNDF